MQMKIIKATIAAGLAALAMAAAGCGDDDSEGSEEAEESVTAEQALTEIREVRRGLDEALAAYREGDGDAAEEAASSAYLEHFELVEVRLDEADHELNEELEEMIREELRAGIAEDAALRRVVGLVEEIDRGLDEAERALSAGA